MSVRVRFAPSPTGYLHVGGLRTALYNYFFAKKHNGKCILRIEDTDRTRFVENAMENLIESLSWAGIEFDEGPYIGGEFGPYIQSERFDLYRKYADILLNNGSAYYAFDSSEELEKMRERLQKEGKDPKYERETMKNQLNLSETDFQRLIEEKVPYVIRLKVPHNSVITFNDIIRGEIAVNGKEIDDQILLKSDGFPTYHLANVVDDYLMQISHVIRGEEWLPSTPKHCLLYDAFGWERPRFAHLPLLLNKDKTKLSKRQGDVAVEDYRAKGFLKDALVNFIALLGWNPSSDREIYKFEELISNFTLEKVNKSGAVFDLQKLIWMNAQYLRAEDPKILAEELKELLNKEEINFPNIQYLERVIILFKERISLLPELLNIAKYMFIAPTEFEESYFNKHWNQEKEELIKPLIKLFRECDDFSHHYLHTITINYCESQGKKLKDIIHPIRLIITGVSAGAGMFETMELLGKEECIKRFDYFINFYLNSK